MTTSLDSSVLIDIMRGRALHLRERFLDRRAAGELFVISALVHGEIMYGVDLCTRPDIERLRYSNLFSELRVEPFTASDSGETARLRAELTRLGSRVEAPDVYIGGQARARGWTVATGNLKHFNRMPDLLVEDWSA